MPKQEGLTFTEAFHSLLRTLCIAEFPCGDENWVSLMIVLRQLTKLDPGGSSIARVSAWAWPQV